MGQDIINIYTDGACLGNPGPGGWGVVISKGGKKKELWGGEGETTNNKMELTAAIRGLKALKRKPLKVRLHSDATYVVHGMTKWIKTWKAKNWGGTGKKAIKNRDLWEELDALAQQHEVEWVWVRGHSGVPGNERADALANRGIPRQ